MRFVTDSDALAPLAAAISAAPAVGFDCEFLSQDRLVPQLCLLQVAYEAAPSADPPVAPSADAAIGPAGALCVAVVDCLAVDVRPLVSALAAHPLPIAHAPRQDLQLLLNHFGLEIPDVFDVQIAAAFLGLGDQVGYARLVGLVLGHELVKDLQWTEWARRPLSEAQLAYAAADVAHLLPLYRALVGRLGPRLPWVQAESRRLVEAARLAASLREEDAWADVSGAGGLAGRALANAAALAGWRLTAARQLDVPLGRLLPDKLLVDLARRPPRNPEALRRRVEQPEVRERSEELLALLERAATASPPVRPPVRGPLSPRADAWASGLLLIAALVAGQTQIAQRFLATRADAESLARAFDVRGADGIADHPVMRGWRRHVIGEHLAGWLRGDLRLVTDATSGAAVSLEPSAAAEKVAGVAPDSPLPTGELER